VAENVGTDAADGTGAEDEDTWHDSLMQRKLNMGGGCGEFNLNELGTPWVRQGQRIKPWWILRAYKEMDGEGDRTQRPLQYRKWDVLSAMRCGRNTEVVRDALSS